MSIVEYVGSVQKVSSHVLLKIDIYWRTYKIQETLYIGQWCLSPLQSRHLGTSRSSPNRHQLPCHIFPESHQWPEISSLSKVILVLAKARSHRAPNLSCSRAKSPGWFDVSPKTLHKMCCDEAAHHQLPTAAAFWIIQIVSVEEWSSLMQNLMQICCSDCSAILNAKSTLYTCSVISVYLPHWLVQWSRLCSCKSIPVHSTWLPDYIDITTTVIISTMVGLFPDRPHTCIHIYQYNKIKTEL